MIKHKIDFYREKAKVTAGSEVLNFTSRLFVDNRWLKVSYQDGEITDGQTTLNILWHTETNSNGIVLSATLQNLGKNPLKLGAFHLMESSDTLPDCTINDAILVDSGGGWSSGVVRISSSTPEYMEHWTSYFCAEEDIEWVRSVQGDLGNGSHYSLGGILAYQRRKRGLSAWIFSFVTPQKRCAALPMVLADPATGNLRAIAFSNNFAGYELAPNECIDTEEILLGAFDDSLKALEDWATFCAARRQIKIGPKRPPVGWLSWYGYRLTQNAADTLRTADLINSEFAGLDFEYIQLDLGYNKSNLPGDWFEVNDHFPEGLGDLSQKIAERNLKFGVWVCPFMVAADSKFAKEHPEALLPLHPNDGKNWPWEPYCPMYQLDSTHPEGEKFLRRIVKYFKSLGVCYFKFDFCGRMGRVDKDFVPYDHRKIKGVEVYRHGLKVLMEMMEPSDYVYWCSNLLQFGLGLGSTSMTACDIGNTGFSAAREVEGRTENSEFFLRQTVTTISRYYLHKKLYNINPDALNVAPPADLEECRLRATLVAMSGGQMFLGDRFDLAESDRFDLIRQCAPPYGEAARPVDLFKHIYPESYPHVWHLHVNTQWDEREVVSLWNFEVKKVIEVDLVDDLMLDVNQKYHAWEFWEKQSLGIVSGSLKVEVPALATRMVVLVAVRQHPWVLSTSFHFTQGGVDLSQVKWDAQSGTLSGLLDRPSGMKGEIYFAVPQEYSCSLVQVADGIYLLPLIGSTKPQKWEVKFKAR